eukprot:TRINITY_DN30950_c0_g1_i1.p1 TRINITY_DN30950_c0_g1~~TRINITY_DN30950_c0_g1_i1.p1  ORF type:complete len:121 (-),score=20.50 TRINITY_DN30950_c0_g1_i1:264-626(-)
MRLCFAVLVVAMLSFVACDYSSREEIQQALAAIRQEEKLLRDEKAEWEGKHKDKAGNLFERLNNHYGQMDSSHVLEYLDQFHAHKQHVHKSLKEVHELLETTVNKRQELEKKLADGTHTA